MTSRTDATNHAVYRGRTWHVLYTDKDGQFHNAEWTAATFAEIERRLTAIKARHWEVAPL
jgi:hypothetical protein